MFKKVFRIFNNGNQFGLNYQIQVRRTILCFIHYWTTPDFAPPHCFDTIDGAKNCIYEEYPDAVIYIKCTDKVVDESVKKQCVPLIGLSGEEYNEKFVRLQNKPGKTNNFNSNHTKVLIRIFDTFVLDGFISIIRIGLLLLKYYQNYIIDLKFEEYCNF